MTLRVAIALLCLTTSLSAVAAPADLVVPVSTPPAPAASQTGEPVVLYINGCWDGGCRLQGGTESSQQNRSSLLKGEAYVPEYPYGEDHFQRVVECVREIYAPFNIAVTDQDPGNAAHFETIVAGMPATLGFPSEVAGVAPHSCGLIPNAMSFVFPARLDGNVRRICETIAHEASHPWGLEHAFLCEDTMSYLDGCGAKSFADVEASCGEDQSRPCECGTTGTQNSYRKLLSRFGSANPTPPAVTLMSPSPGQRVDEGFRVEVSASDDTDVRSVELWIDGSRRHSLGTPPWIFNNVVAGSGPHTIEVRAIDDEYSAGSASAEILVGSACASDKQCESGEVCASGVCMLGPNVSGGLGASCEYSDECESDLCLDTAPGERVCTLSCAAGAGVCPAGFACEEMGAGEPICVAVATSGCNASGSATGPWALALLAMLVSLWAWPRAAGRHRGS